MKKFTNMFLLMFSVVQLCGQSIPYQGRLTDDTGQAFNGDVDFKVEIFDKLTNGKKIYEENIGTVRVINGLYSFEFGLKGSSVRNTSELVAVCDGVSKVFNHTLKHDPIETSIAIKDSVGTWAVVGGASDPARMIGSLNSSEKNVTTIYISDTPSKGNVITVSYTYNEPGIEGALNDFESQFIRVTAGEVVFDVEEMIKPLISASARTIRRSKEIIYDGVLYAILSDNTRVRANEVLRDKWDFYTGSKNNITGITGARGITGNMEIPIPPVECEQITLRALNCWTKYGVKLILEGVSIDDFKTSEIEVLYENSVEDSEFSVELALGEYLNLRERYALKIRVENTTGTLDHDLTFLSYFRL